MVRCVFVICIELYLDGTIFSIFYKMLTAIRNEEILVMLLRKS
jgi:hypothetical protein